MSEIEKCPRCIDEELIKAIGNILVCGNCDLVLIDTRKPMLDADGGLVNG